MTFRAQRNNSFQRRFDADFDALQLPKAASQRGSRRGIDAPRHLHAGRPRRRASAGAAAAMRRAQPSTIRHRNGTRRPEAPQRSIPAEAVARPELPPRPELRGTNSASRISEVWGSAAVSRHRRASFPGEKAVGGLFSDFEAVRTATVLSAQVKKSSRRPRNKNKRVWTPMRRRTGPRPVLYSPRPSFIVTLLIILERTRRCLRTSGTSTSVRI